MSDSNQIGQVVAHVVSQVLESNIPRIRAELTERVLQALPKEADAATGATDGHLAQLLKSVSSIHAVSAQRDVLRALLDNALHFSGRAALLVVKGTAVTGWQGRNFAENDSIKD